MSENPADIASRFAELRRGVGTRVVGLDEVVENLVIGLFSGGHVLLTGVPGLAKTLLISTTAELLGLDFRRIQFTPDLMPADVTGTEVIAQDRESGERVFRFLPGPIFANVLLADEINRTPPKTQAALLEAMEEGYVTSVGKRYPLEPPFFVLATQNPIEQEGTYPLPAAQLDRFMLNIRLDYPSAEQEYEIVRKTVTGDPVPLDPVLFRTDIAGIFARVRRSEVPESVLAEAVRMVRATRPGTRGACGCANEWLSFGAGPRAIQALVLGAKARALIHGRAEPDLEDLWVLARPVMRHRLIPSYRAVAGRVSEDDVLDQLERALHGGGRPSRSGLGVRLTGAVRALLGRKKAVPA